MVDKSWEKFGKENPYYGVCTEPQYESDNLDGETLKEFFKTGDDHVSHVLKVLKTTFNLEPDHKFKQILDFGCGTGRLLIPFSDHAQKVTGIDISQSMLDEAKKNLDRREIRNVELIRTDDITGLQFSASFDLVHTFIVLQHIPEQIGYKIIDKLVSFVAEDGYGVIHFTFYNKRTLWQNKIYSFKNHNYWFRKLSFLIKGKDINTPIIQMNRYDLEKVFRIFLSHHISDMKIELTNHGGFLGALIYFKKI